MIITLSKEKYFLLFIFMIAFSIRFVYSFYERIVPFADAGSHDRIAFNLSIGKGYTEQEEGSVIQDLSAVARPPLYPFLLGLIYKIAGHSYPAVWVVQAIIGGMTCILIYFLAKASFGQRVAFFSAIIAAFCFDLVIYTGMLLNETLYIFLFLICFLFLFKAFEQRTNIKYFIMAGIFAGLSALTRPIIMIFFIFLFLWELTRKGTLKGMLFFIFCVFLVISPWIIRNYLIYHQFIPIAASGGENFLVGNNPQANGECLVNEEIYNLNKISYLELEYEGYRKALSFILRHPVNFLALSLKKLSLFWSLIRLEAWWPHMQGFDRRLSIVFLFLFAIFIFSLGILGITFSFKEKNIYRFWLKAFIFLCPLSLIPFFVEARYRLPMYPFMIIFASYGLTLLPQIKMAIKTKDEKIIMPLRISAILITLILFNSIYDSTVNIEEIISRIKLLF